MTPAMIDLLQRLIANERKFLHRMRLYETTKSIIDYPDNDMRGEEIGWINGVNPRTVTALEGMGLVETVQIDAHRSMVYLGSYDWNKPADELFP